MLINQIVGPVLFKIAIRRVGEAGKAALEGVFDEDADVPSAIVMGGTSAGLSLTVRVCWRAGCRHIA